MKLSTTVITVAREYGFDKAVDILAKAGFDCLDFSFYENFQSIYDEKLEFFKELRKKVEAKGLRFNQAHAPFSSSYADEEGTKKRFDEIVRSMERAALLGAENIIVHPCQHLPYEEDGVPEKLFEMNMDFYNRLKPYCEEYGIHVAIENMWQYRGSTQKIVHATCSRPEEFIKYVDSLDSEWFVACLDIGHAMLVCEDPADFVRALGKKRLRALHVHDVDGSRDLHTLPYFGVCNWEKIMKALAEVGYEGEVTYEADGFIQNKPTELYPEYLKVMEKTGRHLIKIFDNKQE